ncbi:MAG TPA: Stp1/IreP family PP2C-type Ser/Thr phosphatase [Thermoanaerobaculia bacterium]|jgi:protein phosphatase
MSEASSAHVPQRRYVVRAALRTDVGLVRSENQDFGMYTTPEEERSSHPGGRLLIVADGMGGHRGGATASRLAAETVKAQYLESETTDIATALRESLARANARIFTEAQANPELRGMGTTTSALAVRGGEGWLAHVGDSRIYLVRNGEIRQLTDDHSLVATMVREGLLTPAEAETHPRRNVLQRSMGVQEDVDIDVRGPIELREGDTFILCSDGLHGLVKEPELKEIATLPIENAAEEFLHRALQRGAPDNVTVIVARVEALQEDETLVGLEETQRGDAVHVSQYDETQRETAKILAVTPEELEREETAEVPAPVELARTAEVPAPTPATAPAAKTTEVPVPQPRRNAALKWALVLVLVLGGAAAWFYWNQQQNGAASAPATATSR